MESHSSQLCGYHVLLAHGHRLDQLLPCLVWVIDFGVSLSKSHVEKAGSYVVVEAMIGAVVILKGSKMAGTTSEYVVLYEEHSWYYL